MHSTFQLNTIAIVFLLASLASFLLILAFILPMATDLLFMFRLLP